MKSSDESSPAGEINVYFGSYTQPHSFVPGAGGKGITICTFDARRGQPAFRSEISGILNPSYLALDGKNEHLIAVSENFDVEGVIHVFRRQPDGSLLAAGSQPSGGRASCHVCVTPDGQVCASSYLDGCESIYPFHDGKIGPREHLFRYQEKATGVARPITSHAHQAVVSPDAHWLYVCDSGLDRIWRHALDNGRVGTAPPDFISTTTGYGPRHLVFHPTLPRVYVICELNAHLLIYNWDAGSGCLSSAGDLPSLPDDWKGEPAAAAIRMHPSAPVLYVSNRNHDSLTAFQFDDAGHATFACRILAGGKAPRDFAIDPSGRWLLSANQNSNHIAIHELDRITGLPTGRVPTYFPVATPACILFAH